MKKALFSKNERPAAKLNITSLMDALTIILIFLLVNYSDQPEERDLPKFVSLPKVSGKIDTQKDKQIFLSVGPNKMTIDKDFEYEYKDIETDLQTIVEKLKIYLSNKKNETSSEQNKNENTVKTSRNIAINADKNIRYEVLATIIDTLSENGFSSIDFINLSKKE